MYHFHARHGIQRMRRHGRHDADGSAGASLIQGTLTVPKASGYVDEHSKKAVSVKAVIEQGVQVDSHRQRAGNANRYAHWVSVAPKS